MRPNCPRPALLHSLTLAALLLAAAWPADAQVPAAEPPAKPDNGTAKDSSTTKKTGKTEGAIPMQADATVKGNISVEAGLLTRDSTKQLFGGWVADRYAVVQVTIGNHSKDQQFLLQDIFFDYSKWGLSGIYDSAGNIQVPAPDADDFRKPTNPGEITSIGAHEIHDSLKSASAFSPRNLVVNGLVLVGTAAGGYAFLLSADAAKGIAAFNNPFMTGLEKFWPDRRIDQQSNVLLYGFQETKVIGKESADKTYAFFPIDRFLTPGLEKLFLHEPALFFNPAEMFLDPGERWHPGYKAEVEHLKALVLKIAEFSGTGDDADAEVLRDLNSPCFLGTKDEKSNPKGEDDCALAPGNPQLAPIQKLKSVMKDVSLNSVRIVVSGIMTVNVENVPPSITSVKFDKEGDGEKFWSTLKTKVTGVIEGKYLTNGKPEITGITLAGNKTASVGTYIDTSIVAAVADGSSDTELHFSAEFSKLIPDGSKLSFQVSKGSTAAAAKGAKSTTKAEPVESMKFEYTVSYTATPSAGPSITKIAVDNDTNGTIWESTGTQITGAVEGTDLTGGTVSIKQIKVNGVDANTETYIPKKNVQPVASGSSDTALKFELKLAEKVPEGSTITFEVTTKDKQEKDQTDTKDYVVPGAAAAAPKAEPPKSTPGKGGKQPPGKGPKPAPANPAHG